jgi:hypothetical protein
VRVDPSPVTRSKGAYGVSRDGASATLDARLRASAPPRPPGRRARAPLRTGRRLLGPALHHAQHPRTHIWLRLDAGFATVSAGQPLGVDSGITSQTPTDAAVTPPSTPRRRPEGHQPKLPSSANARHRSNDTSVTTRPHDTINSVRSIQLRPWSSNCRATFLCHLLEWKRSKQESSRLP